MPEIASAGTGSCAQSTAFALLAVDDIAQQRFTYAGRTLLVNDMGHIFIPEILQGREYRVGSGLAEAAQRVVP